jgi:hypothetical protein
MPRSFAQGTVSIAGSLQRPLSLLPPMARTQTQALTPLVRPCRTSLAIRQSMAENGFQHIEWRGDGVDVRNG